MFEADALPGVIQIVQQIVQQKQRPLFGVVEKLGASDTDYEGTGAMYVSLLGGD